MVWPYEGYGISLALTSSGTFSHGCQYNDCRRNIHPFAKEYFVQNARIRGTNKV